MKQFLAICATVCLISPASGQVISSPDGTWSVTFDPTPPGYGQIDILNAPTSPSNVFQTIWYDATPANIGGTSDRVENNYTPVGSNVGAHSASFTVDRIGGGLQLVVDVTMLDGPTGGALVDLTWTNTGGATTPLKPFAYVDLDVFNRTFSDDFAVWLPTEQAIEQRDDPTGEVLWVGAVGPYEGWQLDEFPFLRDDLDFGLATLRNSGGGFVADWTAALTVDEAQLAPGGSVTLSFGIGGAGIGGATCPSCACVFDPDPACDIFDFLAFQNLFVVGDPCACLMDPDPACDIFDFLAFQNQFVRGCP